VPGGQPGDHKQPHPPRHRHIHHRRVIQPPVRVRHLLGAHPHTLIGDIQQHPAAVQQMPRHRHRRIGRRKTGRVFGQLGQQVHHVVDRLPAHRDPRLHIQTHPLVLLNLRHRRAQHIHQPHRPSPPPRHLMPRQHQQVLAVAPHPRRQVVHLEQIRQPLGILLALLQVINQPDLPLHQRLRPAGQVDKHRIDVAPQRRLIGRQPHRLPVHLIKRPRHLTNLVSRIHLDRLDIQRPGALTLVDPPHRLRQPHPRHLERARAQPAQRADHGPPDDRRADEREGEQEEDRQPDEHRVGDRGLAQ